MQKSTLGLLSLTLGLTVVMTPLAADAGTVVHQIDDENLMVINYQGKPPFKRTLINVSDTAAFARFEAQVSSSAVDVESVHKVRRGAPGKQLSVVRRNAASGGQVEFARFEETSESRQLRRWRGAPGKR